MPLDQEIPLPCTILHPTFLSLIAMIDELHITDLLPGDGKAVVKGALITTHYTGWLEDGTVFDSSHQRGKPFQCVIGTGRVIKGWDQDIHLLHSHAI